MVEVALKGYISVHRRHETDLTTPADSYMPVLPTCTVIVVLHALAGKLKKKTRVGLTCDFSVTSTLD